MKALETTEQVVAALGGTAIVARLTGRGLSAASNWRSFDTFPPDTYLVMTAALEAAGCTAPSSLWRMVEPSPAPSLPEPAGASS